MKSIQTWTKWFTLAQHLHLGRVNKKDGDIFLKEHYLNLHIQIPPTGYVGLILRSTAVATASRSTVEGSIWRYCDERQRTYYACSSVRPASTDAFTNTTDNMSFRSYLD